MTDGQPVVTEPDCGGCFRLRVKDTDFILPLTPKPSSRAEERGAEILLGHRKCRKRPLMEDA